MMKLGEIFKPIRGHFTVKWMPEGLHGEEFLGPTDRVPGIGRVVTKFSVVFNFPLIPKGSFFVLDGTQAEARIAPERGVSGTYGVRTRMEAYKLKRGGISPLLGFVQGIMRFVSFCSSFLLLLGIFGMVSHALSKGVSDLGDASSGLFKLILVFGVSSTLFFLCNRPRTASSQRIEELKQECPPHISQRF